MFDMNRLLTSLLFVSSAYFCVSEKSCFADEALYVGTYTHKDILAHTPKSEQSGKGIYHLTLGEEGDLKLLSHVDSVNPAVLQVHPSEPVLYAISERIDQNGEIESYRIKKDGSLSYLDKFQAAGKSTCFLQFDKTRKFGILINYWDAFIDVVSFNEHGLPMGHAQNFRQQFRKKTRQVLEREDHWKNRQVGPHAHSAHFWNDRVFIPDLGERAIFQYTFSSENLLNQEAVIKLEDGAGPRHMVINEQAKVAYVSDELRNQVIVARLDDVDLGKSKPRLEPIQYLDTIPEGSEKSYVSEILLSPDNRFLYVSNRGHDSISIFKVSKKDGTLRLIGSIPTGGAFPRHFAIAPSGKYLIVANQDSDLLTVFARDSQTGLIHRLDKAYKIPSPNYIKFVSNSK